MNNKTKREVGKLHSSVGNREGGKKVDIWKFNSSFKGMDTIIEFEVALLHDMSFLVKTENIHSSRFKPLQGSNIHDLFLEAEEVARQEFDLNTNLIWTNWLEVIVKEGELSSKGPKNAGLNISYRTIPRAEDKDGNAYAVLKNNVLVEFPTNIGIDRNIQEDSATGFRMGGRGLSPEAQEKLKDKTLSSAQRLTLEISGKDHRDASSQFTYLPDTPENRAGLDSIISTLEQLSQRLQVFLAPGEIQKTLTSIVSNGPALLNPPEPKPSASPPKKAWSP